MDRDRFLRKTLPKLILDPMLHFVELRKTIEEIEDQEFHHTVYGRVTSHKKGAGFLPLTSAARISLQDEQLTSDELFERVRAALSPCLAVSLRFRM